MAPASAAELDVSSEPTSALFSKNGFQVHDSTPGEARRARSRAPRRCLRSAISR